MDNITIDINVTARLIGTSVYLVYSAFRYWSRASHFNA